MFTGTNFHFESDCRTAHTSYAKYLGQIFCMQRARHSNVRNDAINQSASHSIEKINDDDSDIFDAALCFGVGTTMLKMECLIHSKLNEQKRHEKKNRFQNAHKEENQFQAFVQSIVHRFFLKRFFVSLVCPFDSIFWTNSESHIEQTHRQTVRKKWETTETATITNTTNVE